MHFLPSELIRKKRFGGEHSQAELHFLIQGYTFDRIPDYQMAAWLMATCLKGMTPRETAWLTEEMRDSGVVLDLHKLGVTVDKHSTGGVGDKTSILLAPLVAAAGVPVPMMAGRGLGHTGGTVDKLESISGFQPNLDFDRFKTQVETVGCAIISQSKEICPADSKIYALRDVTGTVESLPLICASIMSKKLAEGMSAIVLDVKYGSGAFMKTLADAESLATALQGIARAAGRKSTALITRMDEPLGRFIGNGLEIRECLDIFQGKSASGEGKGYSDTIALTAELAAHMIVHGEKAANLDAARSLALELLNNGEAFAKFKEMCAAQGGDPTRIHDESRLKWDLCAQDEGFFSYSNVEKIGLAGIYLGAGRKFRADILDLSTGIEVFREQGDKVSRGDILFRLHYNDEHGLPLVLEELEKSFTIEKQPRGRTPLIAKVIS